MAIMRYSTGFVNELGKAGGSSYADILANGVIYLYGGSMPADADSAEGSTEIVKITESGLAFAFSTATNGINWGTCTGGVIAQAAGETWQGTVTLAGTIAWGRFHANDGSLGASTTAKRVDFDVNTANAILNMAQLAYSVGGIVTITNPIWTLPKTVTA